MIIWDLYANVCQHVHGLGDLDPVLRSYLLRSYLNWKKKRSYVLLFWMWVNWMFAFFFLFSNFLFVNVCVKITFVLHFWGNVEPTKEKKRVFSSVLKITTLIMVRRLWMWSISICISTSFGSLSKLTVWHFSLTTLTILCMQEMVVFIWAKHIYYTH